MSRTGPLLRLAAAALLASLLIAAPAMASIIEFTSGLADTYPDQIVTGPDGALWFTDTISATIDRISTSGQVTKFGIAQESHPTGITVGPDGNLWFTEQSQVGRITPSGQVNEFNQKSDWPGDTESYIVSGSDRQLWFTEDPYRGSAFTSEVAHVTTSGQWSAPIPIPGNPHLDGIALAPDGNVWFLQDAPAGLGKITPAGQVTQFLSGFSPGDQVAGLGVGPDGALWFLDNTSVSLGRMTTDGSLTWFPLPPLPGKPNFRSLTAGPGGTLWFTGPSGVGRFSLSSGKAVVTSEGYHGDSGNITLGPDGNLWFDESSQYTPTAIVRMTPGVSCAVPSLVGLSYGELAGHLAGTTCTIGRVTTLRHGVARRWRSSARARPGVRSSTREAVSR